jgi:triphosphatase
MDELDERPIRVSGAGIRREHGELRAGESGPLKASYRVVERSMSPVEALRALCAASVQHLEGNRYGALADADPEHLHQMRVALRRLRTVLDVFADVLPAPLAAELVGELRWLSRALGRARDWDVFLAGTLRAALTRRPRHAGLRAFRAACEELSGQAKAAVHRALESQRYYALMRALRALSYDGSPLAPRPARPLPLQRKAVAVVAALAGKTGKRGRKLMRLDSEGLHRLRNAVRKLRYALMFLAPLLPPARSRSIAAVVEALQETLGTLNDCAVGEELIGQAREKARGPQRRKARKILAKSLKATRTSRRAELKAQWEAFLAAEKEWTYSSLRMAG